MLAIVAEGDRGRVYLTPLMDHERIAQDASPEWEPKIDLSGKCRVNVSLYGMNTFSDLFTDRQLVVLTSFSDLVSEVRERIRLDAVAEGLKDDGVPLREGGTGATAYAEAVGVYLALCVSRQTNRTATINVWNSGGEKIEQVFARQAIPMTWDFTESNPFCNSTGNFLGQVEYLRKVLEFSISAQLESTSLQLVAQSQTKSMDKLISTDPPYYDNIGYADLSDYFFVWLRRSLRHTFPSLFATLAVPKSEELVATPYRHEGSRKKAEAFFMTGMTRAMQRLAEQTHPGRSRYYLLRI